MVGSTLVHTYGSKLFFFLLNVLITEIVSLTVNHYDVCKRNIWKEVYFQFV